MTAAKSATNCVYILFDTINIVPYKCTKNVIKLTSRHYTLYKANSKIAISELAPAWDYNRWRKNSAILSHVNVVIYCSGNNTFYAYVFSVCTKLYTIKLLHLIERRPGSANQHQCSTCFLAGGASGYMVIDVNDSMVQSPGTRVFQLMIHYRNMEQRREPAI